jgi:hypothetical protein
VAPSEAAFKRRDNPEVIVLQSRLAGRRRGGKDRPATEHMEGYRPLAGGTLPAECCRYNPLQAYPRAAGAGLRGRLSSPRRSRLLERPHKSRSRLRDKSRSRIRSVERPSAVLEHPQSMKMRMRLFSAGRLKRQREHSRSPLRLIL